MLDLDNILVRQKDTILSQVTALQIEFEQYGYHKMMPEKVDQVYYQLEIVRELWDACSYSYKYREIAKLLDDIRP